MKTEIKESLYGRGVFSKEFIKAGEVVEIAPVLLIPKGDLQEIDYAPGKFELKKTRKNPIKDKDIQISRYVFFWNEELEAIALGYGSLYNHSSNPNIKHERDYQNETITFIALKDLNPGEELYINYGYNPEVYEKHHVVASKVSSVAKNKVSSF